MNDGIEIIRDGNIAEIILNRKETYNAFNLEMVSQLAKHLAFMAVDNSVRGIIITGKGPSFCAGGDLRWAVSFSEKSGHSFRTLASQFHLAVTEIRRMKKPVVTAINRIAAGGGFLLGLA
jgi:2-(1,2-epoxy-1,2-dihydrophenyl)acetyl-CoA isomerase